MSPAAQGVDALHANAACFIDWCSDVFNRTNMIGFLLIKLFAPFFSSIFDSVLYSALKPALPGAGR